MSTSEDIAATMDEVSARLVTGDERVEGKLMVFKPGLLFFGVTCVAVVTDSRLVVQPIGGLRNAEPKGQAISIPRDEITRFEISGFGSDWREAVITSDSVGGFKLKVETASGGKLKLGVGYGGPAIAINPGAGPAQTQGVAALLHMLRLVERSASV